VYRTDLITDREVLAAVDAKLALEMPRWPSMTQGRLAGQIDKIVAKADADAVRRRKESQADREVWIADLVGGVSEIHGRLLTFDAHALEKRLNALSATVCERDPRTGGQRRADALGALAAGVDRLVCRCGRPDCGAGKRPAAPSVVIHVIAEQAAIDGSGSAPASEVDVDGLIPPELVEELAKSAKLVPLVHPADARPEPGYLPSAALADFVRCRDLTCRWPGCDRPAPDCDLDHTIPYAEGGRVNLTVRSRRDHQRLNPRRNRGRGRGAGEGEGTNHAGVRDSHGHRWQKYPKRKPKADDTEVVGDGDRTGATRFSKQSNRFPPPWRNAATR
jgi:Domain of unknown function (DUF222)